MSTSNVRLLFGLKLKNLRLARGLSLKELSRLVSLSPSYLNEIERGKKHPKPEKIEKLASALGVSYDELVSQKLDSSQNHFQSLLASPALQKIPFNLFGVSLEDIISLIPNQASKGSALVSALVDISRSYDMRVEEFFHTALRCYQEMFENYFEDIEQQAESFRTRHKFLSSKTIALAALEEILVEEFGVKVDYKTLEGTQYLSSTRSILLEQGDGETLLVHSRFNEAQRSFLICREIGFRILKLEERGHCSPDVEVQSFEQVLNAFKASYFASSVLLAESEVVADLKHLFSSESWNGEAFLSMIAEYPATPEMFFYRLSEVLPRHFGLKDLHFLRFDCPEDASRYELVKQLNMSRLRIPTGLSLNEEYCRRWMSIKVLERLSKRSDRDSNSEEVGVQISKYLGSEDQFFCICVARQLGNDDPFLSSVTIGFRISKTLRSQIKFLDDEVIENDIIGETCERCALAPDECSLRAAAPRVFERDTLREKQREELEQLLTRES